MYEKEFSFKNFKRYCSRYFGNIRTLSANAFICGDTQNAVVSYDPADCPILRFYIMQNGWEYNIMITDSTTVNDILFKVLDRNLFGFDEKKKDNVLKMLKK
jgi:hypothetical protein